MNDYIVIDNFLDEQIFLSLQNLMLNNNFPWYINNSITGEEKVKNDYVLDNYFFNHLFYLNYSKNSDFFDIIIPLLEKLNVNSLIRCHANLYQRTSKKVFHDWHKDHFCKNNLNWKTSVYYLNSNNGYTVIKNNNKKIFIESIENRMLIFPSDTLHKSTTCTDQKYRCVINTNYY